MKFKQKINCDSCEKSCRNLKIRKGRFLCYICWTKEITIIPIGLWEKENKNVKKV